MTKHELYQLYDKCLAVSKVRSEEQAKVALRFIDKAREQVMEAGDTRLIMLLLALEMGLVIKVLVCESSAVDCTPRMLRGRYINHAE